MKIKYLIDKELKELKPVNDLNYLITSAQNKNNSTISPEKVFVLIPNFFKYTRLLASNKHKECLMEFKKNMNMINTSLLSLKNLPSLAPTKGIFWPAVLGMSLVDLSSIRKENNVVIHSSVVDLAFHTDKHKLIKKIISSARKLTNGKIGLWTLNSNLVLSKTSLRDLGIDFILTPLNEFKAGMKVNEENLVSRLKEEEITLVKDYVSHFKHFSGEIETEDNSLIY